MQNEDAQGESSTSIGQGSEPLACVSCRARKLKCDRTKGACNRCTKIGAECVYPESRRKPAFKRRNVKELEARIAQVENLLKDTTGHNSTPKAGEPEILDFTEFFKHRASWQASEPVFNEPLVNPVNASPPDDADSGSTGQAPPESPPVDFCAYTGTGHSSREVIELGMFEAPPPFEVIEELHNGFFTKQHHYIPIIHPGKYLNDFHSAPHRRPPMALQYSIWTMAANGHEKYHSYHDAFYRRARQYLEADELKGFGEHFMTVSHAQAWALVATDEGRCMLYTRAAMSSARVVRLVTMMGLHRLDDPSISSEEMSPVLDPPKNWVELEERRRVFWGAFCIEKHAGISAGWPSLIETAEVTTRLPTSEQAFRSGRQETMATLPEALNGASYASFSGAIILCHLFDQILKHVHRPKADDHPEDLEYGNFWKRHREIDNVLSSVFMFLPESFRLPKNLRDPSAVHTNLNLHASVICLHNAACDKADVHNLPGHIKSVSKLRLITAAAEIVNIVKMSSHINSGFKSPMSALSLYCATSVYVYLAKEDKNQANLHDLEILMKAMEAIGRQHKITKAFLKQAVLDIERNGLTESINIPWFEKYAREGSEYVHNIPLLARSSVSRHSRLQPPLPGRLPLGNPMGGASSTPVDLCPDVSLIDRIDGRTDTNEIMGSKRRRVKSPQPEVASGSNSFMNAPPSANPLSAWPVYDAIGKAARIGPAPPFPSPSAQVGKSSQVQHPRTTTLAGGPQVKLAHRTGSPVSSPSVSRGTPPTLTTSSNATPGTGGVDLESAGATTTGSWPLDATLSSSAFDENPQLMADNQANHHHFQGPRPGGLEETGPFTGDEGWDLTNPGILYEQLDEVMRSGNFDVGSENELWPL